MRIIVGDCFLAEITHFRLALIARHLVAPITFDKPKHKPICQVAALLPSSQGNL